MRAVRHSAEGIGPAKIKELINSISSIEDLKLEKEVEKLKEIIKTLI